MLTNNWNSAMYRVLTGRNAPTTSAKRIDESPNYLADFRLHKLFIGTGTTKPKKTDYKLESEISSDLYSAIITDVITTDFENENSICKITAIVSNLSDENISVSEIGIAGTDSSQNTASYQLYLFAREVLDNPIVIAPGASKAFEIKLA